MSKLDALQKFLFNDLRVFRESFFEDMEGIPSEFPEQTLAEKESLYRVPDLDYFEAWHISGIVGGRLPSTYSESPRLWNPYFKKLGIKGAFFGFDLPLDKDFDEFQETALKVPGMLDFTITDPYKNNAYEALKNTKLPVKWSDQAKDTNTVNHIIVDGTNGELLALNTDGIGMLWALKEEADISGKKVLIIGAGGSAASIGYEFVKAGCDLFIANRTLARAEKLEGLLSGFKESSTKIKYGSFDRMETFLKEADVVINTVAEGCPLDDRNSTYLKDSAILAETKYGPKADLKHLAAERDIKYVDGRAMLFGQFVEAAGYVYPLFGITIEKHRQVIHDMRK